MSKSMTHLRRMKKTELQEELRKNGVAFSSSALKPELLSLYKLKVLPSGFSTDEEEPVVDIKRSKMLSNDQEKEKRPLGPSDQVMSEARRSPRKPKKPLRLIEEEDSDKLLQDTRSSRVSVSLERLDSLMIDERSCKDLSNKELAAKLKAKGVSVGPIGPTTRRLYERKLEKISAQEVIPKREYSDQDSSEPEEEEVEIEKPTPLTRSLRKRGTGCDDLEEDKNLVFTDPGLDTTAADSPAWQVLSFDNSGGVAILESAQLVRKIEAHDSQTDLNCHQTKMSESSDSSEGEENASLNASAGQTPYHPKVKSMKNVTPRHTPGVQPRSDHLTRMKLICESATKRPALYSRRGVKERNVEGSVSESVPPSSGMETTKPERRWLPFWVTIAIVSIIVTILYFVYITMEENPPRFLP